MMMSEKASIKPSQLFAMIILFELGTAIVIPVGLKPDQAAWLSTLVALPGGILLFLLYNYLARQYPNSTFGSYVVKIVGKPVGWLISLMYIPFFVHASARNLREAGELLITTSYDQTPMIVIHSAMMVSVVYILYKGLNVFFRLGEIYFVVIIALGLVVNLFIIFSGSMNISNLLPLLGDGWTSVFHTAYPYIVMFPYAEVVCFCTVFPYMKQVRSVKKTGLAAIMTSGLLISFTHASMVSVLGADIYTRSTFPLFASISIIHIANFLQRFDAIVIFTLIIGVFFKLGMYSYAALTVTADLFKISNHRKLAYPIGLAVFFTSLVSAWSFPEHDEEGLTEQLFNIPMFAVYIPVLLCLVHLIRKKAGDKRKVNTIESSE